jgi:hypothetical protein
MIIWERIYRVFLKAYPGAFYKEYSEPMAQVFRDQLREAARSRHLLRFLGQIVSDLVSSVLASYWHVVGGVMLLRRLLGLGLGIVLTCAGFWITNLSRVRPRWLSSILMESTSLPFPVSVIFVQILLSTLDLLILSVAIGVFLTLTRGFSSKRFLRGLIAASVGLAIGRISSTFLGTAHLLPYSVRPGAVFSTGLLSMLFGLALSIWVIRQNANASPNAMI